MGRCCMRGGGGGDSGGGGDIGYSCMMYYVER